MNNLDYQVNLDLNSVGDYLVWRNNKFIKLFDNNFRKLDKQNFFNKYDLWIAEKKKNIKDKIFEIELQKKKIDFDPNELLKVSQKRILYIAKKKIKKF